jgi:hypothetical protein
MLFLLYNKSIIYKTKLTNTCNICVYILFNIYHNKFSISDFNIKIEILNLASTNPSQVSRYYCSYRKNVRDVIELY